MMKRKNLFQVLLTVCLLLVVLLPGRILAAGGYIGENQNNGSVDVINEKTGKLTVNLYLPGKHVNPELAGYNNSRIYFTAYKTSGYSTTNYLYYYDLKKKYIKYLRTLPAGCYQFDCNEVYDGYVYLSGWNPSDNIMLYRCKTNGKNLKKIVGKAGYSKRYGKYIICDPRKVMGAFSPYNIYVYNTKTGKNKNAVKRVASYNQSSKYIYAAVMLSDGYPGNGVYYKIVRYNMETGKTGTLVKAMKAYIIRKINSKYVWYHTEGSYDTRKYYRLNIAALKIEELTRAAFEKSAPN